MTNDTRTTLCSFSDSAECIMALAIASATIREGGAICDAQQRLAVADELVNAITYLSEKLARDASDLAGSSSH